MYLCNCLFIYKQKRRQPSFLAVGSIIDHLLVSLNNFKRRENVPQVSRACICIFVSSRNYHMFFK